MGYKLRPYQEEAVSKAVSYFLDNKDKKNKLIVAPTSSGKALMIAEIANRLDGNVLCLCPNSSLVKQNYEEYIEQTGLTNCAIYCAGLDSKEIDTITFGTINSIKNNTDKFKDFDYCIIDEADLVSPDEKSMYNKLAKDIKVKKYLGLTATPIRFKGTKLKFLCSTSPKFFSELLYHITVKEIISYGYWSKLKYIQYNFDKSRLTISGPDFDKKILSREIKRQGINNNIYILTKKLLDNGAKSIIIYTDNVKNAKKFEEVLPNCRYITHDTDSKERALIENKFKNKEINVLVNYSTYTEGFNYPELEYIIIGRPTMSVRLYQQIVGRIVRKHKNKEYGTVIDFGGNVERFGKVEDIDIIKLQDKGWQLCSNNRLLTDIDIRDIGRTLICPKKKKITKIIGRKYSTWQLNFGNKYNGRQLRFVPRYYLEWMKNNVEDCPIQVLEYLK